MLVRVSVHVESVMDDTAGLVKKYLLDNELAQNAEWSIMSGIVQGDFVICENGDQFLRRVQHMQQVFNCSATIEVS